MEKKFTEISQYVKLDNGYIDMNKFLSYDIVKNFNTLKAMAKMGLIVLDEKTGPQKKFFQYDRFGKMVYRLVSPENYILSAKSPQFFYKGVEYFIGVLISRNSEHIYVIKKDDEFDKYDDYYYFLKEVCIVGERQLDFRKLYNEKYEEIKNMYDSGMSPKEVYDVINQSTDKYKFSQGGSIKFNYTIGGL